MSTNLTDLGAVLAYLAGPAGIVAWMVYVSNWFRNATEAKEDGTQLVNLSGWQLQLVTFIVSALPPTIAYIILAVVPPETLAQIAPTYQFFATLFLAYLAQQAWFAYIKTTTFSTVNVSVPSRIDGAATSDPTKSSQAAKPQSPTIHVDVGGASSAETAAAPHLGG